MAREYLWDDFEESDDQDYYDRRVRDRDRAKAKREKEDQRQESVWAYEKQVGDEK